MRTMIVCIIAFLFLATFGTAETIQLTLEDAIGLGLKNSITLKTKMLAVYSARAEVQSAKSAYYPTVSLVASYTHIFKEQKTSDVTFNGTTIPGSFVASSDPITISTDINQTIYTFGTLRYSKNIAEQNVKLAEMDFEEEKRKLIVEVKRAFYWYILATEVLKVQEETLKYKEEALDVTRKRFNAGLSPEYEILSAESDLENYRPGLISSKNQVQYALLAVKDLLGVKNENNFNIDLIGKLEHEYFPLTKEKLLRTSIEKGQEILAAAFPLSPNLLY